MASLLTQPLLTHTFDGLGVDTIEHENKLWLVPEWIDLQDEGTTMPKRIVCLSSLNYQKSQMKGVDFLLTRSIPKAVLFAPDPSEHTDDFLIVENPPIRIRGGFGVN